MQSYHFIEIVFKLPLLCIFGRRIWIQTGAIIAVIVHLIIEAYEQGSIKAHF